MLPDLLNTITPAGVLSLGVEHIFSISTFLYYIHYDMFSVNVCT